MRITLIHNPTAGGKDHTRESLTAALHRAGYHVDYWSSKDEHYPDALRDPGELVVVAGGDGTIDKVAQQLMGSQVPMAILPLGTANNVARTFGMEGDISTLIGRWSKATPQYVDLGVARSPWGEAVFLEAAGLGFFPQMIPAVNALLDQGFAEADEPEDKLQHDLISFRKLMSAVQARDWQVRIDGCLCPGAHLMLEVMNIKYIGPQLCLAPDADPSDGYFDVVLIGEGERGTLAKYLEQNLTGRHVEPTFKVHRAQHIELVWDGTEFHADSDVWAEQATLFGDVDAPPHAAPATVVIAIHPQSIRLLG